MFKDKTGKQIPKTSEDLIKKNLDVAFMVLHSVDLCALKLSYMEKGASSLKLKNNQIISMTEIIQDFDIYKSLNYVIIWTRDGKVSLFTLKQREFVFSYSLEMRLKSNVGVSRLHQRPVRPVLDRWRRLPKAESANVVHELYDPYRRGWHGSYLQKRYLSFWSSLFFLVQRWQIYFHRYRSRKNTHLRV